MYQKHFLEIFDYVSQFKKYAKFRVLIWICPKYNNDIYSKRDLFFWEKLLESCTSFNVIKMMHLFMKYQAKYTFFIRKRLSNFSHVIILALIYQIYYLRLKNKCKSNGTKSRNDTHYKCYNNITLLWCNYIFIMMMVPKGNCIFLGLVLMTSYK